MTAVQERPAGRPAGDARPAGARPTMVDPLVIRRALAISDQATWRDAATETGVNTSTIGKWRRRRAAEAASGREWPSDQEVAAWHERVARRRRRSATRKRWQLRTAAVGGRMHIDPTGTRRRLQALAAMGWRYGDVADQLGVIRQRVAHLAIGGPDAVHRDTAAAIAAVYDQLSMRPGPSRRCRALAANRGWPPPLAWDDESIDDPAARPDSGSDRSAVPAFDEVAVERAMHGDRVHLRPVERAEAMRRLTAAGQSAAQIAALLDTSTRAVVRHRTADTSRRSA